MDEFIILTKEEANAVRGDTSPWTRLEPFEMKDGTFILPVSVLSDPAHAKVLGDRKAEARVDVFAKSARYISKSEMKADEIDGDVKADPDVKPATIDSDMKSGA